MKVLWVTPNLVSGLNKKAGISKGSGGWISGTVSEIIDANIELHVLTINNSVDTNHKSLSGIYLHSIKSNKGVFSRNSRTEKEIQEIIDDISPDIIDLQGIEFCYSAFVVKQYREKVICTLQGLISNISTHYGSGLSYLDIIKSLTLRDFISQSSIYSRKSKYTKRGKFEVEAIENAKYFIGRTSWDKKIIALHNSESFYFKKTRAVSSAFSEKVWKLNGVRTVFVSQCHVPIKGLHTLLDSLSLLKERQFIINVIVGGRTRLSKKNSLLDSNYERLLRKKIKKNGLVEQVKFIGLVDQNEMVKNMLEADLYIQPSYIENSPNSTLEALRLGMPCLLSDVGGTKDLVQGSGSVFYRHDDHQLLSYYLKYLLTRPDVLVEMSNDAQVFSNNYSYTQKNTKILDVYNKVFSLQRNS
jgi:glycosyltransferase involved in cell wall biosynthesis